MDEVHIRKATDRDLEEILKLNLLLFQSDQHFDKSVNMNWTYGNEGKKYFKEKILKLNCCALVAQYKGKIIGYLVGGLADKFFYRLHNKPAELENMFVLEEHRSKGVGSLLVNDFIHWCKKEGVDYVLINTLYQNEKAINFYEKNMFEKLDIILARKLS